MKSRRANLILELVKQMKNDESKNAQKTNLSHEECTDNEDYIPGTPEHDSSPIPSEAHNVIEQMKIIFQEDAFSDDIHETSGIIKSPDKNINLNLPSPAGALREDHFMSVYQDASSPFFLHSVNQHSVGPILNVSPVLTPLNTLISDLSPFPQPITPTIENNGGTPMPSQTIIHGGEVCSNAFCPGHDNADHSDCPSFNTADSSCQSSPAPLIRCRGKKRVRNYNNWKEVKRKRLMNAGKEYSSKKGVIVPAKVIGRPCTCRNKCYSMLSVEEKQDAFEKFWKLGDRKNNGCMLRIIQKKEKRKGAFKES